MACKLAVMGPRGAEGQQVTARFQVLQVLGRQRLTPAREAQHVCDAVVRFVEVRMFAGAAIGAALVPVAAAAEGCGSSRGGHLGHGVRRR